jgi:hypothetical protein
VRVFSKHDAGRMENNGIRMCAKTITLSLQTTREITVTGRRRNDVGNILHRAELTVEADVIEKKGQSRQFYWDYRRVLAACNLQIESMSDLKKWLQYLCRLTRRKIN